MTDELPYVRNSDNYKAVLSLDHSNQTLWFVGYTSKIHHDDYHKDNDGASTDSSSQRRLLLANQSHCFQEMLTFLQSLCTEEDQMSHQHWCDLLIRHHLPQEPHRIAFVPNWNILERNDTLPTYVYRWDLLSSPQDLENSNHSASNTIGARSSITTSSTTNHQSYFDQWIIYHNHSVHRLHSNSPFRVSFIDTPSDYHTTTSYNSIPMELYGQGMHRTLSYSYSCKGCLPSTSDDVEKKIVFLQLLPQETYVETLPTKCHILASNITNQEAPNGFSHTCQIHTYLHQPMDVEQPSFVSSPYIIAYSLRIVPTTTNTSMLTTNINTSNHTPSTSLSILTIQWDITLHFRYPPTEPSSHRRAQVMIHPPFPLVSSLGAPTYNITNTRLPIIATSIPAGSSNDLFLVSIITHLTVFFGCAYMLRSILQFSCNKFPNVSEVTKKDKLG